MKRIAVRAVVALLLVVGLAVLLAGCDGSDLAAGEGDSMADQMYTAIVPKPGEQMMVVQGGDTTPYLLDRLTSVSDAHPDWRMQNNGPSQSMGDVTAMSYIFSDGSTITLFGEPRTGMDGGMRLTDVKVER